MRSSFVLIIVLPAILCVSGCKTTKPDAALSEERVETYTEDVALNQAIETESFEVFIAGLRDAVATKNMEVIASLMTSSFGYQLNPIREGEGVFQYWDEKNLWAELELILNEEFSPLGDFLVAPVAFAVDPENYSGYRAGMFQTPNGWRFAYFVRE